MKAAFIFLAPGADAAQHTAQVDTPVVKLSVVGVKDYAEAVAAAQALVANGVTAIELCGGFGNEGAGLIAKAVRGKAQVGAVRFDGHPGLEFKSGDDIFA